MSSGLDSTVASFHYPISSSAGGKRSRFFPPTAPKSSKLRCDWWGTGSASQIPTHLEPALLSRSRRTVIAGKLSLFCAFVLLLHGPSSSSSSRLGGYLTVLGVLPILHPTRLAPLFEPGMAFCRRLEALHTCCSANPSPYCMGLSRCSC